ncbi:serine O-acetyltransferase [Chitiniphilus shinanonensis]|uniref:Serine acetyltransferase n=1 Tax=Chitiniphilus shinanonensis TaxID=553088 RepID=A0ABQ6BLT0_9NEIS|nr:serine O-acetyltransferase [Chitiniphilus shinanonensis]GLS02858.1 serine O-acetyltransferase [Chitiniphilus shinanonensis]
MIDCLPRYETPALDSDPAWRALQDLARAEAQREPLLRPFLDAAVLAQPDLAHALAVLLADLLADGHLDASRLYRLILDIYAEQPALPRIALEDLDAVAARDPATRDALAPLLYYRGYRALQAQRIAHWLWRHERRALALWVQSRNVALFSIDIHPAARIGARVMLDHGTGIVIGETAVVEDDVSILHGVTLGGTGKAAQDRHPKVRRGVMIGAGAKVLGNIEVGEGARVAAGSIVLKPVPPHATVAGVPAREVARAGSAWPALDMRQTLAE